MLDRLVAAGALSTLSLSISATSGGVRISDVDTDLKTNLSYYLYAEAVA